MLCYPCAKSGAERPAVALCTSCSAGLCLEHLRETSARFASDNALATCHHDTWTASNTRHRVARDSDSRVTTERSN
jgi:hypothetical protein